MPRLESSVPRYRKHKRSGQAVVTLSGQDFYLGPHGTKVSKSAYDRAVAEWLARGRRPVEEKLEAFTITELIAAYIRHAKQYYRKGGVLTSELHSIVSAVKPLKDLYGKEPASEFGPLKLKAVQQAMVQLGWSRKNINKQIARIVRMFGWGVAQELVAANVAQALREVDGLRKGRTSARETAPIVPVADATINATVEHLPAVVADMVRFQRLTGARPDEVCRIRPAAVDTSTPVWAYRVAGHKTDHHDRQRIVFIGPKAQAILRPYLLRDKEAYCFCPADSERKRRADAHERRTTPMSCGNKPGSKRKRSPARPAGDRYTAGSYRRAIHRACELAFDMPRELRKPGKAETTEAKAVRLAAAKVWRDTNCWAPNQLRHAAATEIRKTFGLEGAQVALGHSNAKVSEIYAERDLAKAASIMQQIG